MNLGKIKKGETLVFNMYYGYFRKERDALKCIKGAKINLYSLGQDTRETNTFLFGFKKSISTYKTPTRTPREKCIDPSSPPPPAPAPPPPSARSAAADDVEPETAAADAAPASGKMSIEDKVAMNEAAASKRK